MSLVHLMPEGLRDTLAWGFGYFFPLVCPLCDRVEIAPGQTVCLSCESALTPMLPPWCERCGRPLDAGGDSVEAVCVDCTTCPPPFDHAWSVLLYDEAVKRAITRMKYGRDPTLALALAPIFERIVPDPVNLFGYDVATAVPLHASRLRWRGFNQALVLARPLCRRFGLRLAPRLLVRLRQTEAQAHLDREARLRNLSRAFSVPLPSAVRDRRVLLFDDVFTTGMTVSACALALREAGAARVDVLTLARALPGRAP